MIGGTETMKLITKFMTKNDCYKAGRKIKVKGIMVHSTATPGVMAGEWYDRWNKPNISKCVHAFLDDEYVFQYLPWNHRGWHAGGAANNTHVAFEICEPENLNDKEYFNSAYANAVELCVMLCKEFGLDENDIIDHSEGNKRGIASHHGDVKHWFPKHGKSMDTFREDVQKALNKKPAPKPGTKTWELYVQGNIVKELQAALNELGFRDNERKRLDEDGYLGDRTLEAIEKVLVAEGDRNSLVKVIQSRLQELDYKLERFGVDGVFGNETKDAVMEFQKDKGLAMDSIVGINTLKALFRK
jgi:N-acetyl-anhydromuramyl-L-alanine amidase AmpD